MEKRKHDEEKEEHVKRKIRKLEKKLQKIKKNKETAPMGQPPSSCSIQAPPTPLDQVESELIVPEKDLNIEEEELPEEYLLALGNEGQEKKELGPSIRQELATRWSKLMSDGLEKEARETLLKKYPTPENFQASVAPILNVEIGASLSETSHKRDKRIINRQNMVGTIMTCLGKSLTSIFKGELNTKCLIEEINDAAKIAAEIFYQESNSRKFFALTGTSKMVKDAIKNSKADQFLFGVDCAEKIKTAQQINKTSSQLRGQEKTEIKKSVNPNKKQVNWRSPLPQMRNRSGPHNQRYFNTNKQYKQTRYDQPRYSQPRRRQQRRTPPRSRPRHYR